MEVLSDREWETCRSSKDDIDITAVLNFLKYIFILQYRIEHLHREPRFRSVTVLFKVRQSFTIGCGQKCFCDPRWAEDFLGCDASREDTEMCGQRRYRDVMRAEKI